MNPFRVHVRKMVIASAFVVVLLAGTLVISLTTAGSSAHADEPAAVYYGYVVPEPGNPIPTRVRALSERGFVCGSAEVVQVGASQVGFYALSVIPEAQKAGCPRPGESVRFVLVYGLIDENILVGIPAVFRPGEAQSLHLLCSPLDRPLVS